MTRAASVVGVLLLAAATLGVPEARAEPGSMRWPVSGYTASFVGYREHPVTHEWKLHDGHDIAAPAGAPVFAASDGRVRSITSGPSCGGRVELSHADGLSTVYLHVSAVRVGAGQVVRAGQPIASVVATSSINRGSVCSTGDHLHFEIRRHGTVIDWDNRIRCGTLPAVAGRALPYAPGAAAPPWAKCPVDHPVAGDWNANGSSEPGFHSTGGHWTRRNSNLSGHLRPSVTYGRLGADVPVVGDWDGDGVDDLGIFRPGGEWHLRSRATGSTWRVVSYGKAVGDVPVVGDWDGDGVDDLGIFRPGGEWHLRSSVTGSTWRVVSYGKAVGDVPVVGDWDGDGVDDLGIFRPGGEWHLRSSNALDGRTDETFDYGKQRYDIPIAGDWDADGDDDTAIYRHGEWHLRADSGATLRSFTFGE